MLLKIAYRILSCGFLLPLTLPLSIAHAQQQPGSPAEGSSTPGVWKSAEVQHTYGFPDTKPKAKGTLSLDATTLTFNTKSSNASIPRSSITSVTSGSERVELWGTGGRILRMAIPNGGGMAAAAFMHHRIGMLTVAFADVHGGMHGAVFYVSAADIEQVLEKFAHQETRPDKPVPFNCGSNPTAPSSVLLEVPNWEQSQVPAAYRTLFYEHAIDRLKQNKNIAHVYRFGETGSGAACPEYIIQISVEKYKAGNQVVRASTGPIGMFASPTQLTLQATYSNTITGMKKSEEIKASVRTESESIGVADGVAKKLAKQYEKILKDAAKKH